MIDQVKSAGERSALDLLLERQKFARPYVAPPAIPRDRAEILRRAFDATVRDPQFIRAAEAARLPVINPMSGEELSREVERLSATAPEVTARLATIFEDYLAKR